MSIENITTDLSEDQLFDLIPDSFSINKEELDELINNKDNKEYFNKENLFKLKIFEKVSEVDKSFNQHVISLIVTMILFISLWLISSSSFKNENKEINKLGILISFDENSNINSINFDKSKLDRNTIGKIFNLNGGVKITDVVEEVISKNEEVI